MSTYTEEIKYYLSYCEKQKSLSLHSIRAYKIDMQQFISFLKNEFPNLSDILSLDKVVLQKYVHHLAEKYAVKTCKRKIASLKAFFNHLEFEDIIEVNPLRKVRTNFKEPQILPKTLKLSDIKLLLANLYKRREHSLSFYKRFCILRQIAILELLFSTGMRVGELCHLMVESIDLEQGCIKILGKGRKERIVYISSPEVFKVIREYIQIRNELSPASGYLLVNRHQRRLSEDAVRYMLKALALNFLKGKHITPHMFRHTFASLLLEAGLDVKYIQELLGHSSIQTTLIYLHISNAAIKSALVAKHPRSQFQLLVS